MQPVDIQNTVVFEPVVGSKYEQEGQRVLGQKVMIVGASHYCQHMCHQTGCGENCKYYGQFYYRENDSEWYFGKKCEKFSHIVVKRYREYVGTTEERRWFRTFSRFYNIFFEKNPSHEMRAKIFDYLIVTEYVQGAEANDGYINNRTIMSAKRNFNHFVSVVRQYRPDVVILWGSRAWSEVLQGLGVENQESPAYATIDQLKVTLVKVPHPSSRIFIRSEVRKQLADVGIRSDIRI